MDLIYANQNRTEIGVIRSFSFDVAFGKDENDFSLTIPIDNHCCSDGWFVYVDGTEYGGIIDKIKTNSEDKTVTYSGRTWHGILASHIIEPTPGNDYRYLSGDANHVIQEILDLCDMEYFRAAYDGTDFIIRNYQVQRYIDSYTLIRKVLSSVGARLNVEMADKQIVLSAVSTIDYSSENGINADEISLIAERNSHPLNHLVCLGSGDLAERNVIHLYTDKYGNIQSYKTTSEPKSDADYILDKSMQQLFGADEVASIYDYPNAETKTNYVAMETQPEDWESDAISTYYEIVGDEYKQVESWYEDVYTALDKEPIGWSTTYTDYLQKDGDSYVSIPYVDETYELTTSRPSGWGMNYKAYYIYSGGKYIPVTETTHDASYQLLASKPSNWGTNCTIYYTKSGSSYKSVSMESKTYTNYSLVTSGVNDWETSYSSYFYKYTDGTSEPVYKPIPSVSVDDWILTTSVPSNWSTVYKDYYIDWTYEVWTYKYQMLTYEEQTVSKYVYQEGRWNSTKMIWEYTEYLYDERVPDIHREDYTLEYKDEIRVISYGGTWKSQYITSTEWLEPYSYEKSKRIFVDRTLYSSETKREKVSDHYSAAPIWVENRYYKKSLKQVAPKFRDYYDVYGVYRKVVTVKWVAPTWEENKFYKYVAGYTSTPVWEANTYYEYIAGHPPVFSSGIYYEKRVNVAFYPTFIVGKYYRKHTDHFADLVANALDIFDAEWKTDSIEISVNESFTEYNIGDIIGAEDSTTGMSIKQSISKKIVKISDGEIQFSYETEDK